MHDYQQTAALNKKIVEKQFKKLLLSGVSQRINCGNKMLAERCLTKRGKGERFFPSNMNVNR